MCRGLHGIGYLGYHTRRPIRFSQFRNHYVFSDIPLCGSGPCSPSICVLTSNSALMLPADLASMSLMIESAYGLSAIHLLPEAGSVMPQAALPDRGRYG